MATETVLSDHHSPDTTMEKVDEEIQTVKLEDVDPPKEVGGKDEEEKLDADGLAGSETPVNKLEETTGMQTKLLAAVEVEEVEDAPVVDIHVEADSEKIENFVLNPESLSASGTGDETVETQSGAPEKQCIVVEKVDNPSLVDVPAEVYVKVVENSVLDPESDSASKLGEMPVEQSVDALKVDDGPIVDIPTDTGSKVVENSVLDPEPSSEPVGEIVERQLEAPKGDTIEVEKVDGASVADVLAEAASKKVENSVLEPESSASEPVGVAVERLSEEHPTVVEKVDDATIVDVPCEASLEEVENSVPDPESSSASKPGDEMVERQSEVLEEHPVEVEKVDSIPIVDFPAETGVKRIENSLIDAESSSPSEPGGETVQRQLEATNQHSATDIVETQQQEQAADEAIEQPEEKPSVGTADPDSSIEAVDKPAEHLEVIPVKESELEVAKEPEAFSEEECKIAESPGLVTKVEGETGERAEVIKGVEEETEEIEPSESLGGEIMTSEGTMADKSEANESLKEEETSLDQEPVAYDNSVPTNQEAQVDPKEEEGDSSTSDVIEKAAARATDMEGSGSDVVERLSKDETVVAAEVEEEKEEKNVKIEESGDSSTSDIIEKAAARATDMEGSGIDVVERLSKDETVVAAKVEEEKEEKNVKIEESEGKSAKVEESVQTEPAKTDNRNGSNFVTEVAEIDTEQVSRDVEVVAEMKKMENVKEDIPLSVEADKDKDGEGKMSEVDAKETVKTNADNLESAKEDGEIAKSNPPNSETLKNGDDSKTSVKPPKQDDSVKKHSNNIISKVKQSIVKVKKAIIGKSPSSKALLPEAKGDEKVK